MIGLEQGEKVLAVVRRHWFLFALDIGLLVILAVVPPIVIALVPNNAFVGMPISGQADELGLFLYCLWLLFLWVAIFVRWTDYYLDIWVVTDKRVIDVEQKGLFNREITTASLERIQNVTINVRGLFATLLGFGDVQIETAGAELHQIVIRSSNNPERVKEMILRASHATPPVAK